MSDTITRARVVPGAPDQIALPPELAERIASLVPPGAVAEITAVPAGPAGEALHLTVRIYTAEEADWRAGIREAMAEYDGGEPGEIAMNEDELDQQLGDDNG